MGILKWVCMEANCSCCRMYDRDDYLEHGSKYDYAKDLRERGWKVSRDLKFCLCPNCIKKGMTIWKLMKEQLDCSE